MSSLIEFDPVWAESGDTGTAPDDTKIETGFVGGERVQMERLNYLQKRSEDKIDDVIRGRVSAQYDGLDIDELNIAVASGLYGNNDWGKFKSSKNNAYYGANTANYVDLCVYLDATTNEPRILALNDADTSIDIFDPRGNPTLLSNSGDLSSDLPAATGTWHAYSMCSDGTSVYVFCTDTHGGADTHAVQAWDIASWDVKGSWGTGTVLSGSGTRSTNQGKDIVIANATHLAVAESWTASVAATAATKCIELLALDDGAIDDFGQGDLGATGYFAKTLASDGINLFFVTDDTTNVILGTATLADLTAGSTGSGYPLSLTTDVGTKIVAAGDLIITASGSALTGAGDTILRSHLASAAVLDIILRGESVNGVNNYKLLFQQCTDLTYDGLNIWVTSRIENTSGTNSIAFLKIDVAQFWEIAIQNDAYRDLEDLCPKLFSTYVVPYGYNPTVFDTRDIWTPVDVVAGNSFSGYIGRIPLAIVRG